MNNWKYKLARFMMGRRGFDQMSRGMLILIFILIILEVFFRRGIINRILRLGVLVLFIYTYYRAFSRNIPKRAAENQWYLDHVGYKLEGFIARDRKNYKYFKCPQCGEKMRAPKGRGRIRVNCHKCGSTFEKKV